MPGPQPVLITLSERVRGLLEQMVRRQTNPQRLVRRARVILMAADGIPNQRIADTLEVRHLTVRTWRGRFAQALAELEQAEAEGENDKALNKLIESILTDEPRPGCPPKFEPEQLVEIVAIACEDPQQSGRPISHWTPREVADEAQKRKIVENTARGAFFKTRWI